MAASMGFENTTALAHHIEDFLDDFRKTGVLPEAAVDRLLAGIDLLEELLANIEADEPEPDVGEFIAAGEDQLRSNIDAVDGESGDPGTETDEERKRTFQVLI